MKPIRSFVLRQGRITGAQRAALDTLWHDYGVELTGDAQGRAIAKGSASVAGGSLPRIPAPATLGRPARHRMPGATAPLDLDTLFGRSAPRVLEIGFGMGDALAEMAGAHPEQDFLGIEVHRPGIGNLLRLLAEQQISNVRVVCADAVEVLSGHLVDGAFDAAQLFFPDPWPKRRHHKRRIVQPPFVALVAKKLKRGGRFHLCTDWEEYAAQMLEVLDAAAEFTNACPAGGYAPRGERPRSKFERRATCAGRRVLDIVFSTR